MHTNACLIYDNAFYTYSKKSKICLILPIPAEDSQRVTCQVKAADRDAELVTQAVMDSKGTMERVVSAWETYNNCMASLQTWLAQKTQPDAQIPLAETQVGIFQRFIRAITSIYVLTVHLVTIKCKPCLQFFVWLL